LSVVLTTVHLYVHASELLKSHSPLITEHLQKATLLHPILFPKHG